MTKAERKWDQGELDLFSAGRAETPSSKSAAGVLAALGLDGSTGPGGGEDAPVSGFHSPSAPISAPRASGIFSRPWAWVGGGVLLALVPAALLLKGSQEANTDVASSALQIVDEGNSSVAQNPRKVTGDTLVVDDAAVVQLADLAEEPASLSAGSRKLGSESATSTIDKADEAPSARPSLAEELAIIKQARDRLSAGDVRGAESALSEHAQKFQPPRLSSEARVIRVEILMKQGKKEEARQVAAPLMKENSPYRARMETLLSHL